MEKTYLGDGVYVQRNAAGDIVLTTENGVAVTNEITIEQPVWQSLLRWVMQLKRD